MGITLSQKGGKLILHNVKIASEGVVHYKGDGAVYRGMDYLKKAGRQLINKGVTYKHPEKGFVGGVDSINDIKGTVLDTRLDGNSLYADITLNDNELVGKIKDIVDKESPLFSSIGYEVAEQVENNGEYNGVKFQKELKDAVINHLAIGVSMPRDKTAGSFITSFKNDGEDGKEVFTIEEINENTTKKTELTNQITMTDNVSKPEVKSEGVNEALLKENAELKEVIAKLQKEKADGEKVKNDSLSKQEDLENRLKTMENILNNKDLHIACEKHSIKCDGFSNSAPFEENLKSVKAKIIEFIDNLSINDEQKAFAKSIRIDGADDIQNVFAPINCANAFVGNKTITAGVLNVVRNDSNDKDPLAERLSQVEKQSSNLFKFK